MEKVSRASNIELMRVVCIMMIIASHYAVHTAWGVMSKGNVKNKIWGLWRDRWFYSVLVSVVVLAAGLADRSVPFILRAVFPVLTCRHNYVTTFIMLYFFIPYINKLIHTLTKKEFRNFIILLTFVISVIPTVLGLTGLYTNNVYSYLFWMIYVYCVGAFLRLNEEAFRKYGSKFMGLLSVGLLAFIAVMEVVVEPQSTIIPQGYTAGTRHGMIPLLTSVAIFLFFLMLPCKTNKIINGLASSTFAVLLIHDDPVVRNVLWNNILKAYEWGNHEYLWVHALVSVIAIWIICIMVDKIYVWLRSKSKWIFGFLMEKRY